MRVSGRFFGGALLVAGCAVQPVPVPGAPSPGVSLLSPSPAASASVSLLSPSPAASDPADPFRASDGTWLGDIAEPSPDMNAEPGGGCWGRQVRISGRFIPTKRVSVWIEPLFAPLALSAGFGKPHAPFGVQVAEANVTGTDQEFAVDWTIAKDIGRLSTGGTLRAGGAGQTYLQASVFDDAGRFIDAQQIFIDTDCGRHPAESPERPSLAVLPASPCPGQEVELRGTGFPAGDTFFELQGVPDRSAVAMRSLGQTTVGPDGGFTHKFRYETDDADDGMLSVQVVAFDANLEMSQVELPQCR